MFVSRQTSRFDDPGRDEIRTQPLLAVRSQLLLVETGARDYYRANLLDAQFVMLTEYGHLIDAPERGNHCFDPLGADLVTADIQNRFFPPGDHQQEILG